MRARLIGTIPSLTRSLHPRLPPSLHFAAPARRKPFLLRSERALRFPCPTDPLSRSSLPGRAYRGSPLAMASDFQPQLARQPPSEPLPKAPNGGKVWKFVNCDVAFKSIFCVLSGFLGFSNLGKKSFERCGVDAQHHFFPDDGTCIGSEGSCGGDVRSINLQYANFLLHLTRRRTLLMHERGSKLQLITEPSLLFCL
jgi:hypothetical protein